MAQTYYYKVSVNDGNGGDATSANYGNERTYCKGECCDGVGYTYPTCNICNGNKTVKCSECNGNLTKSCNGQLTLYNETTSSTGGTCYDCRKL